MRHRIFTTILIVLWITTYAAVTWAEQNPAAGITQGEFALHLVKALGWDAGLPQEAKDRDLLVVLLGRRYFKFEAEEHYDTKRDNVSVRSLRIFGPYSGNGWVSGVAVPSTVHLRIFLPLEGDYVLKVAIKGDGQKWSIGDKAFTVGSGGSFREIEAGTVHLTSGPQNITVELPPEGAVDYLILSSPSLPPLEPAGGWRFKQPLNLADVAHITVTALGLESKFAADQKTKPIIIPVAEAIELPPTASTATINYYGQFVAKKWLRAGFKNITAEVPIKIMDAGVYGVRVRYLGEKFSAYLDDEKLGGKGKPYFEWIDSGNHQLSQGIHKLILDISPSDGVDVVELTKRQSSPEDYLSVAGLKGDPSAPVTVKEADSLIGSLVERLKARK